MTHFRPAKFLTLAPLLISAVACNARHSNSAFHPSWMTTLTGGKVLLRYAWLQLVPRGGRRGCRVRLYNRQFR